MGRQTVLYWIYCIFEWGVRGCDGTKIAKSGRHSVLHLIFHVFGRRGGLFCLICALSMQFLHRICLTPVHLFYKKVYRQGAGTKGRTSVVIIIVITKGLPTGCRHRGPYFFWLITLQEGLPTGCRHRGPYFCSFFICYRKRFTDMVQAPGPYFFDNATRRFTDMVQAPGPYFCSFLLFVPLFLLTGLRC